ncbi:MAG: 23S rRNA (guanosine(2251)-2'-O)-methyltransferase RlmB [Xanthobacteraceae bacterium]
MKHWDAAHSTAMQIRGRGKRWEGHKGGRKRQPYAREHKSVRKSPAGSAIVLYGWHTVKAALENPQRRVHRLFATENAARRLAEEGIPRGITPELVRPSAIAQRLTPDAVHNGLLAEVDPLPAPDFDEIALRGVVLLLDQITDPHNVGAIMRTAAAFGAEAVITTARHSPEASGVLAKSASGALDYVPLITVQNLAHAMETLRERGVFVIGLDSTADAELSQTDWQLPVALVLGAEGKGLRQRTRDTCDALGRLSLPGKIQSLNVSNAAALALYVITSRTGVA